MKATIYPHINTLLEQLLTQIQAILGEKLVGMYLYGSLVAGDYDDDISDVDLFVALASDLTTADFNALKLMHDSIVAHDPQWDNRIEIAYLSLEGLKTFRTKMSKLGIISPGEPFHIVDAGQAWLMNWYFVREIGVTLYGAAPQEIIAPITKEEFIQAVKEHVAAWRGWLQKTSDYRGSQAYAILTMCRALYTTKHGQPVSKIQAATWAKKELPAFASTIQNAVIWRKAHFDDSVDHAATMPETQRFVHFIIQQTLS